MFLRCLAVVLVGNALAVSEPLIDDMGRVIVQKLGGSTASQVDPQTGPRFHARAFDDLLELSTQVDTLPFHRSVLAFAAVSANDPLCPIGRLFKGFLQQHPQFREQWDQAALVAFVMLGFWRRDEKLIQFPIDVFPFQTQGLARNA